MKKSDDSLFAFQKASVQETFGDCPKCDAPLQFRRGKGASFLGCSRYPECDYSQSLSQASGIEELTRIQDSECPDCGAELAVKKGRFGLFIGCTEFPECHFIANKQEAPATGVACPVCDTGVLKARTNRFGKKFYACDNYPKCRYLLNQKPVLHTCPQCQWPVMVEVGQGTLRCPQKACGFEIVDQDQ